MHNYLQFRAGDGSFVLGKGGKVHKVPANDKEALRSSLMGMFEKLRQRSFFIFVQNFAEKRSRVRRLQFTAHAGERFVRKVWSGGGNRRIYRSRARAEDERAVPRRTAIELVKAVRLYSDSMARFGTGSPYIYPLYGLGELPQGFARLSAVHGGTYMLGKSDIEVVYDGERSRRRAKSKRRNSDGEIRHRRL